MMIKVFENKIYIFYIICFSLVGLISSVIAWKHINILIVCKFIVLGVFFVSTHYVINKKIKNYGLSILLFFVVLLLISFIPFVIYLIVMLNILFMVIALKKIIIEDKTDYKIYEIVILICLSLIISIIAMTRSPVFLDFADLLINTRIFAIDVHKDSLMHISIANMIKNNFMISTGLHGTPFIPYHIFSHIIYGSISKILNIQTFEAYGYATSMFFIPLLFMSILSISETISPSEKKTSFYINILFLISVFIGFLGRDIFAKAGFHDTYFVSESYLLGIIILLSFIDYLFSANSNYSIIIGMLYITISTITKVSIGYVVVVLLISNELLFRENSKFWKIFRIVIFGICGLICYKIVYGKGDPLKIESLYYIKNCAEGTLRNFSYIPFFVIYYFYSLLAVIIVLYYYCCDRNAFLKIKKLFILLVITILSTAPVLIMVIPGCSGYHFLNICMFVSLPIIFSLKNDIPTKFKIIIKKKTISVALSTVLGIGLGGAFIFGIPYVYNYLNYMSKYNPGKNPNKGYIEQFLKISSNHSTENYCIYIPKSETEFWNSSNCSILPFTIPAISGRPGLFILPNKECNARYYGYEYYDNEKFLQSSRSNLPDDLLCHESKKLGFKGYIIVNKTSYQLYNCREK